MCSDATKVGGAPPAPKGRSTSKARVSNKSAEATPAVVVVKEKRTIVISFRATESDMAPYAEPMLKSGKSRSEFFHELFIKLKDKIVISERKVKTEDYSKYLFLVNKMSNNLNQIAKVLNSANKADKLSQRQLLNALNDLNSIRLILNGKLGNDN
ncbi:plasmid mobilization relaxosome protein MobC [Pseudomonas corrugata]|uniref:plasmid mobilization relaxosome protein MobC n=1 Tax=Pseudomonas corrugata TaxID=47879 RepID=UPI0018E654F0|nr:plasmid mobilization relaxosome protein MobC [Pseudomonas corrugata]MBI6621531.1 plasmid mobilization relaxosome protein MobC [Pseudomonas corrugata]MBI6694234.1 plasmid mobilization relaxosome protein MobC [Pseudomonas corrugata]